MATYKTIKYIVPTEVVEHTDSINALADVDTSTATPTEGQTIKWNGTNWVPGDIEEAAASSTQKAIFGFGKHSTGVGTSTNSNRTNLVSSSGVVASDNSGVGTARGQLAAAGYGGDKALFGFGGSSASISNLISNTGVVSSDTTHASGVRYKYALAGAGFGGDKAIFGFGFDGDGYDGVLEGSNLVSNTGVVAVDTAHVSGATARKELAAAGYGGDKAIFGFGNTNISNLVSNTGVVSTDQTGVGTSRRVLAAAGYGGDKAIFGFGFNSSNYTNVSNLVSNTGVVSTDQTGVGKARASLSAAGYGGDKALFGFGSGSDYLTSTTNTINLVSNTGVVASDTIATATGSARSRGAAAGYSTTA